MGTCMGAWGAAWGMGVSESEANFVLISVTCMPQKPSQPPLCLTTPKAVTAWLK